MFDIVEVDSNWNSYQEQVEFCRSRIHCTHPTYFLCHHPVRDQESRSMLRLERERSCCLVNAGISWKAQSDWH